MNKRRRILIVEDQKRERDALSRVLRMEGYGPIPVSGIKELQSHLQEPLDLAVCDLRLGSDNGIDALKLIRENWPGMPVIMVTAYGAIDSAVEAIKAGAIDYLTKPLKPAELLALLNRYLPMAHDDLSTLSGTAGLERQLGNSSKMIPLYVATLGLSSIHEPVLICGEQGSGHEIIAAAIHENSPQTQGPFVEFRVSSFSSSVAEQELFGYRRTDYYSRTRQNKGRIAQACNGTLFVDDFFSLPTTIQQKLLHLLNGNHADHPNTPNVKLIAAAGHAMTDLQQMDNLDSQTLKAFEGRTIDLPPLRDHSEDVPQLIDHYLSEYSRRHLRPRPSLDTSLLDFLYSYEWPGNVRQLRNTIENMLVLSRADIISKHELTAFLGGEHFSSALLPAVSEMNLSELERIAVIGALKTSLGNKTHAAQRLGISVRTLQRKMKMWKLEGSEADA